MNTGFELLFADKTGCSLLWSSKVKQAETVTPTQLNTLRASGQFLMNSSHGTGHHRKTEKDRKPEERLGAGVFCRGGDRRREGGTAALLLVYHYIVTTANLSILGIYTVPFSPLTNLIAVRWLWLAHISPWGLNTTPLYFKYDIMENGVGL